jgi:hypothetical protein
MIREIRKAQSSLEYLTTYNWAILALALAATVVFTQIQTPCINVGSEFLGQNLKVNQYGISINENLKLSVKNSNFLDVNVTNLRIEKDGVVLIQPVNKTSIRGYESKNFTVGSGIDSGSKCDQFSIQIYYNERDFERKAKGNIKLNYEPGEAPPPPSNISVEG